MSSNCRSIGCSSVVRKQVVALSGMALCGFMLTHMLENMLILVGAEIYNRYTHFLTSNPLIPAAEVGLALLFVVHILMAIVVTAENRSARSKEATLKPNGEKDARFGSRSMILSGLLVLAFLVLHLITFRFGDYYRVSYGGVEMRDLYRLVIEKFNDPLYTAWYVFALLVLGVHLSHGASAFVQTLGLGSVRNAQLRRAGWIFAFVVAVGFISQPLYAILIVGGR